MRHSWLVCGKPGNSMAVRGPPPPSDSATLDRLRCLRQNGEMSCESYFLLLTYRERLRPEMATGLHPHRDENGARLVTHCSDMNRTMDSTPGDHQSIERIAIPIVPARGESDRPVSFLPGDRGCAMADGADDFGTVIPAWSLVFRADGLGQENHRRVRAPHRGWSQEAK